MFKRAARASLYFLLGFLLSAVAIISYAGGWVEQTGSTAASPAVWVNGGLIGESACLAVKAAGHPASYWQFQGVPTQYSNETKCRWYNPGGGNYYTDSLSQRWACGGSSTLLQAGNGDPYDKLPTTPCNVACPSGMIEQPQGSTTICVQPPTCPEGQHYDSATQQCVPDNPCASTQGQSISLDFHICDDKDGDGLCTTEPRKVSYPLTTSHNGCGFTATEVTDCYHFPPSTSLYCSYTLEGTGEALDPSSSAVSAPSDTSSLKTCPDGQSIMTLGNKVYCFASGENSETTTQVDDGVNPPSSETISKSSQLDPSSQTVTTTTTNSTTGTTTTVTQPHSDFCADNPSSSICQAESAGGQGTGFGYEKTDIAQPVNFYDKKYPNGLSDPWNTFQAGFQNTSLHGFVTSLTAGLPQSGTCPSWSLPISFLGVDASGFTLEPPCIIWPFIKAITILSALFFAYRLVFGGA